MDKLQSLTWYGQCASHCYRHIITPLQKTDNAKIDPLLKRKRRCCLQQRFPCIYGESFKSSCGYIEAHSTYIYPTPQSYKMHKSNWCWLAIKWVKVCFHLILFIPVVAAFIRSEKYIQQQIQQQPYNRDCNKRALFFRHPFSLFVILGWREGGGAIF